MNISQVKGKVVVVIGASRGIGRAIANLLSQFETKLVLGARNIEELEEYITGKNVFLRSVDVTDEQSVQQLMEQTISRFGRVDVLVNTAGVGTFTSVLESSTEDFDNMIAVNLRGTYLTCKYFGRQMKMQQDGQIINMVSIAGNTALPGGGGYSASKFGVLGLTRVLQTELRKEGVRITSVIPGAVASSFWDQIEPKPDVSKMIPVENIAEQVLFLLTQPKSSYVDEITIMPPDGIL